MKTKAERLEVAGAIAPSLRESATQDRVRRVARVDAEGNVVGYVSLHEVKKALLKKKEIEIDVVGVRQREVMCKECGLPFPVTKKHGTPTRCPKCWFCTCAFCGKTYQRKTGDTKRKDYKACLSCRKQHKVNNVCKDCGKQLVWNGPRLSPERCAPCANRSRRLPRPKCHVCGKELASLNSRQDPPICLVCHRKSGRKKSEKRRDGARK